MNLGAAACSVKPVLTLPGEPFAGLARSPLVLRLHGHGLEITDAVAAVLRVRRHEVVVGPLAPDPGRVLVHSGARGETGALVAIGHLNHRC